MEATKIIEQLESVKERYRIDIKDDRLMVSAPNWISLPIEKVHGIVDNGLCVHITSHYFDLMLFKEVTHSSFILF